MVGGAYGQVRAVCHTRIFIIGSFLDRISRTALDGEKPAANERNIDGSPATSDSE
jgi:hypothetical protein